jgi:hypothetical protein
MGHLAITRTAVLCALLMPGCAWSQEKLVTDRASAIGATFETWTFGSPLYQPTLDGSDSVRLLHASQLSVPISTRIPLGANWTLDAAAAYTSGTVKLAAPDASLGADQYSISGLTDVRVRLTGRLVGDHLIATLGLNAPTGKTSLNREEFSALRILAASALGFETPTLGLGRSGTVGLVSAHQIGRWTMAVAASFEMHKAYTPISLAQGTPDPAFTPSNVYHVSLAADGLFGQNSMTFTASADAFGPNRLTIDQTSSPSGSGTSAPASVVTQLGPIFIVNWQLHLATSGLRELTLYAVDQYRTPFSRADRSVAGSNGNYLDVGLRTIIPASSSTGILAVLSARHQTGLESDNTLATTAVLSGALTFGLEQSVGGGLVLEPFIQGQYGRFASGTNAATAHAYGGGLTLALRY